MTMLNRRGAYFDIRSGNTWDLFFPGYYRSEDQGFENHVVGTRPVGDQYAKDWFFNERDFDLMRQHVEDSTGQRWQYSGGSDLILVNAYVPEWGEPTVDWESIQSGVVHPPESLASIIERITGDLEHGYEDSAYGVSSVMNPANTDGRNSNRNTARDFMVQALAGIASSLGSKAMGM